VRTHWPQHLPHRDSESDCVPRPARAQVVLKEFDLRVGGPGMDSTPSVAALRTVQREVEHLSRLQHPCLIAPDLFFVEPCCGGGGTVDGLPAASTGGGMLVYVQFPWYPTDMERWMATEEAAADGGAAARVVALDVLRGLEHVHRHGVVHCDVKPANVLVTERADGPYGLRRGVLSDFDLSLDQAGRMQLSVASMSRAAASVAGGRGTPGALSMAPEVAAGKTPTDKSDVYSLGGILLRIVCPAEASRWAAAPAPDRWGGDGEPLLRLGSDAGEVALVSAMLRQSPATRPTCVEALQDVFFLGGLELKMQRVHGLEEELCRKADHLSVEAQRTAEEAERARKELREAEERLHRESEQREAELDAKLVQLKLEHAVLESHAATERMRLAEDARQLQKKQEESRRLEAELTLQMHSVHQQKQQLDLDRQRSAEESQQLSAAAKDMEKKLVSISIVDAELEAKRRDLERERDVLASESLSTATACQLLAEDGMRANAVLLSKRRELERRQVQLEREELEAAAERQDMAEQARVIKEKQEESILYDLELEKKRQVMEQERLALADEECRAHSMRRRLEVDAQAIKAELALLEQKKLALTNEESRATAARRRLEVDVQAKNAELDAKRNQLKLEEERLKAIKQSDERQALATQVAIDKQLEEMRVKARQLQEQEERAQPRIPPYWSLRSASGYRLESDPRMVMPLQQRIRETSLHHILSCSLAAARVTRVMRIENRQLWSLYLARQAFLRESLKAAAARGAAPPTQEWLAARTQQPHLDGVAASVAMGELLLFHGTSEAIALTIAEHGFDERLANDTGLYGAGSYFADRSCKSHQYASRHRTQAGERVMLICRVAMGWPCLITTGNKSKRRPPSNPATPGRPFDSIFAETGVALGGQQQHHEFVVFHSNQAYAEFLVYYVE
jgi:serine/threonine protein kinase